MPKSESTAKAQKAQIRLPLRTLLILAGAATFVAWLLFSTFRSTDPNQGVALAREAAPDVTLITEKGEMPLSDLRGKAVVLYFSFPG